MLYIYIRFVKDNAENRRVGSLVVWMDDGIKSDRAIIAIPVNLSLLLNLPQGTATVVSFSPNLFSKQC